MSVKTRFRPDGSRERYELRTETEGPFYMWARLSEPARAFVGAAEVCCKSSAPSSGPNDPDCRIEVPGLCLRERFGLGATGALCPYCDRLLGLYGGSRHASR
jgi:hypothetical protein